MLEYLHRGASYKPKLAYNRNAETKTNWTQIQQLLPINQKKHSNDIYKFIEKKSITVSEIFRWQISVHIKEVVDHWLARKRHAIWPFINLVCGFFLWFSRHRFIHHFVVDFFIKTLGLGSLDIDISFLLQIIETTIDYFLGEIIKRGIWMFIQNWHFTYL